MLFSLHNYIIKVNYPENFPDGEWNVAGIVNACFILLGLAAYCLRTKRCNTFNKILLLYVKVWWCYTGDLQRRFLTQHTSRLLRHCFEWLRHCPNIAALCCAKKSRCWIVPCNIAFRKAGEKYFGILYCLLRGKKWIYPSKYVAE